MFKTWVQTSASPKPNIIFHIPGEYQAFAHMGLVSPITQPKTSSEECQAVSINTPKSCNSLCNDLTSSNQVQEYLLTNPFILCYLNAASHTKFFPKILFVFVYWKNLEVPRRAQQIGNKTFLKFSTTSPHDPLFVFTLPSPHILNGHVLSVCWYRAFVKAQSEVQRHSN